MHVMQHIRRNLARNPAIRGRGLSQQAAGSPSSSSNNALGIAFFSSIVAMTFGLGCWQVQRYQWKVRVTAEEKERYLQSPSSIPSCSSQQHLSESVSLLHGRRVSTAGVFLHDKELLLGPRSAPVGLFGEAAQGLATNPQGYYVITPLRRSDGTVVFVNRGWIDVKRTAWGRPTGQVTVHGIVSQGEKQGSFSPVNNTQSKKLLWLEPAALLQATGLETAQPVVVLEVVAPDNEPVATFPAARRSKHLAAGGQYITPMTHLVYATTWFSLCAAGTFMTYSKFRRGGGSVRRKISR